MFSSFVKNSNHQLVVEKIIKLLIVDINKLFSIMWRSNIKQSDIR